MSANALYKDILCSELLKLGIHYIDINVESITGGYLQVRIPNSLSLTYLVNEDDTILIINLASIRRKQYIRGLSSTIIKRDYELN